MYKITGNVCKNEPPLRVGLCRVKLSCSIKSLIILVLFESGRSPSHQVHVALTNNTEPGEITSQVHCRQISDFTTEAKNYSRTNNMRASLKLPKLIPTSSIVCRMFLEVCKKHKMFN